MPFRCICHGLQDGKEVASMSKAEFEFIPMTQDDLTDELWEAFQDIWQEEAAAILEDCTAKAEAAICRAQKSKVWEAGLPWKSRFSLLAYVVRLAFLKGFAAGQEAREERIFADHEEDAPELDADAAFAECLVIDEFAAYYFDCETTPGPVTKILIKAMGKEKETDC